jgi:hypothetical protein
VLAAAPAARPGRRRSYMGGAMAGFRFVERRRGGQQCDGASWGSAAELRGDATAGILGGGAAGCEAPFYSTGRAEV